MPARAQQLIGREAELGAVVELLDGREDLPGTMLLHGHAGIGKNSVGLQGSTLRPRAATGS